MRLGSLLGATIILSVQVPLSARFLLPPVAIATVHGNSAARPLVLGGGRESAPSFRLNKACPLFVFLAPLLGKRLTSRPTQSRAFPVVDHSIWTLWSGLHVALRSHHMENPFSDILLL